MKKVYLMLMAIGMFAFVACNGGGGAEEVVEEAATEEAATEEAATEEAAAEGDGAE